MPPFKIISVPNNIIVCWTKSRVTFDFNGDPFCDKEPECALQNVNMCHLEAAGLVPESEGWNFITYITDLYFFLLFHFISFVCTAAKLTSLFINTPRCTAPIWILCLHNVFLLRIVTYRSNKPKLFPRLGTSSLKSACVFFLHA